MRLSEQLLAQSNFHLDGAIRYRPIGKAEETIIQFGEGNFLRAFFDWMLARLLQRGLYHGKAVVVQPIANGRADILNQQNGLSTVILRGMANGLPVETVEIVNSISRALNAYTQWDELISCFENPSFEFIVSNTTESGIAYDPAAGYLDCPPASFPGKVAALLYKRYLALGGRGKGLIFLACELSEDNGNQLRRFVLQHARDWGLSASFIRWIETENLFLNTLVDRTVPGYPVDTHTEIEERLGYEDQLLNVAEAFHLWVIEGPQWIAEKLPFHRIGLDVRVVDALGDYRRQKVRLLNGGHTASVPAAFLCGLDTVEDMMNDPLLGRYVRSLLFAEILPLVRVDEATEAFAHSIVERWVNPLIRHYLTSILLNSSSKYKARVIPSLADAYAKTGAYPKRLAFSFAAYIALYRSMITENGQVFLLRGSVRFPFMDDEYATGFLMKQWVSFTGSRAALDTITESVLANQTLWGDALDACPGLSRPVSESLWSIIQNGIRHTLEELENKE